MPSTTIPCTECETKRTEIEADPDREFVSCSELPGQEGKEIKDKKCKLIWKDALT